MDILPPLFALGVMDKANTDAIIVVGIAVAILVGGVILFVTRRGASASQDRELPELPTTNTTSYRPAPPTPAPVTDNLSKALNELALCRVEDSAINYVQKLGSGAFADVWLGILDGRKVAIKALHKSQLTQRVILSFVDEIQLMKTFNSQYIVGFIGAAWTVPSDLKCVMEYMDGGDLKDLLDKHTTESLPWFAKFQYIYAIAQGLEYLHSMNIIHRDIKSRNILLDTEKGAKLTDFGISKEDIQATMTVGVGTFRWMAPEVIQDHEYTVAADIYSFGCILSEFDTHKVPYEDMRNPFTNQPLADPAIMVKVVAGTARPSFTDSCPPWLRSLADQCLSHRPEERPIASQIVYTVRSKLKELEVAL